MGRHATIASRQASSAANRSKRFTKICHEITTATRLAGPDPVSNSRLRLALDTAKQFNMPKENVQRAIKKGQERDSNDNYEDLLYEGYGPGGSAYIVEILSDNRNRTHPEIKSFFQKAGGNLGDKNSVSWMFQQKAFCLLENQKASEEAFLNMLDLLQADDMEEDEGKYLFYFPKEILVNLNTLIQDTGFTLIESSLCYIPENSIEIPSEHLDKNNQLIQKLKDHQDVQEIFYNF